MSHTAIRRECTGPKTGPSTHSLLLVRERGEQADVKPPVPTAGWPRLVAATITMGQRLARAAGLAHPAAERDRGEWTGPNPAPAAGSPPVEIVIFGGPRVSCGTRVLWPADGHGQRLPWELVLLLACHPVTGVSSALVAQALWPEDGGGPQPAHRLRQLRYRLWTVLRQAAPGLSGDLVRTVPPNLYRLFPTGVTSDVQRFLALERAAQSAATDSEGLAAAARAWALAAGGEPFAQWRPRWLDERGASGLSLAEELERRRWRVGMRLVQLALAAGQWHVAEPVARALAAADPYDEAAWVQLLRLYHARADRPALRRAWRALETARRAAAMADGSGPDATPGQPSRELAALFSQLECDLAGLADAA